MTAVVVALALYFVSWCSVCDWLGLNLVLLLGAMRRWISARVVGLNITTLRCINLGQQRIDMHQLYRIYYYKHKSSHFATVTLTNWLDVYLCM